MTMSRRSFSCLAAACCCCCLALLVLPPVQGRTGGGAGMVVVGGGPVGRDHLLSEPRLHVGGEPNEQQRGVTTMKSARPSRLPPPAATATRRVWSELRSVPGGPDPLHHHSTPRRPEQEELATAP